ncbi:MAG: hypothetical protein ACI3YI_10085 [Bacteroidaceae bacterium]
MARESIEAIAREYNGRSKACAKCGAPNHIKPYVCFTICTKAFIEGFKKGVKYQKEQ